MKTFLKWVSQELKKTSQTEEERYLSQATSLEDLERRQKQLMYGVAPFQKVHGMHLTSYYAGMEVKQ